jgi:hypothetical protein
MDIIKIIIYQNYESYQIVKINATIKALKNLIEYITTSKEY